MIYPFLPESEIDARASQFRRDALGAGWESHPVDLEAVIYDYLCERCDLVFDNEQDLGSENGDPILGKMLPFQNKILITKPLTTEPRRGRYRFTVAHEIGHWVLHRPLFLARAQQPGLFSVPQLSDEGLVSLNRNLFPTATAARRIPPEEWQANRFSSALLVERSSLEAAFADRFGLPPLPRREGAIVRFTSLRNLSTSIATQRVKGQVPLYELFGVSAEAMAVTLEARKLVVETTEDLLLS